MSACSSHAVQFYEREENLCGVVSDFIAEGLGRDNAVVVIATEPHRRAFAAGLSSKGFDAGELERDGKLAFIDAHEMLARFMKGSMPDAERFRSVAGATVFKASLAGSGVCAYGEMVDLLWRDGNAEGAIRLEELWDELVHDQSFALLCAYPMGNFYKESHADQFDEICRRHSHVMPVQTGDDASREIAMLQQRAQALATEVEHRKELEKALRDALAARRDAEDALLRHERDLAFLLEASSIFNRSLDYEGRLRNVAEVAIPRLADWCAVDLVRPDGSVERVSAAPAGAEEPDAAERLVMPLKAGDRTIGAITFMASRTYSQADVQLATELARRAAVAIENSRLYNLAQQVNRAKDEFLATLSHELRTPLTAILGWARMLRGGPLDPEVVQTALETIERSARMQAALIDDILDLSRVVTGKISLQMDLVELTSIVTAASDTVRLAATGKRVTIDFRRGSLPIFMTGDATRLQQIVWNLLSNAIKFSNAGSTVTIELERSGSSARITVRDQGIGIRREFLPFVFEPFRQAESSTTRVYGGLGLGLAIVKYFTELHGGSVSAESAGQGAGATFTVVLPVAPERRAIDPPADGIASANLSGTSVLVVEDDDDTRSLIATLLRTYGANVVAARSVDEACRILAASQPDVIVTDIAMPYQDGFALLKALPRAIPTIALTAFGRPEDEQRILAAGFHAYARKPVEPLEFASVVARLREAHG